MPWKKIKKGLEYDLQTDANYTVPTCPECDIPLFGLKPGDMERTITCPGCKTRLYVPKTAWVEKYFEDNTGEKNITRPCSNCTGMMKIKRIYRNGTWRTAYGACERCGMKFIV